MSLEQKIEILNNEKIPQVYEAGQEAGKKTAYDEFWDTYQENGKRTSYTYAFGGVGWKAKIFKPKYPLTPKNANYMFAQSYVSFEGVELDTSNITGANCMFQTYYGENIPAINISNLTATYTLSYMFGTCNSLVTIEKLIVSENTAFVDTMFKGTTKLENITFEGTIAKNGLDLSPCTKLSKDRQ